MEGSVNPPGGVRMEPSLATLAQQLQSVALMGANLSVEADMLNADGFLGLSIVMKGQGSHLTIRHSKKLHPDTQRQLCITMKGLVTFEY
jgi:hypothetical protein